MRLKANVAADGNRHQRHLQIAPAPSDCTIVEIVLRRAFKVERLRLWTNVFDRVYSNVHNLSPSDCGDATTMELAFLNELDVSSLGAWSGATSSQQDCSKT